MRTTYREVLVHGLLPAGCIVRSIHGLVDVLIQKHRDEKSRRKSPPRVLCLYDHVPLQHTRAAPLQAYMLTCMPRAHCRLANDILFSHMHKLKHMLKKFQSCVLKRTKLSASIMELFAKSASVSPRRLAFLARYKLIAMLCVTPESELSSRARFHQLHRHHHHHHR
jgi:hypothetical protein